MKYHSCKYYTPKGGLPTQNRRADDKAIFNQAYVLIPKSAFSDIVTSYFPFWQKSRGWVLARPLSGFAESFAQYIMEVDSGGGSDNPEPDREAQAIIFVTKGEIELNLNGKVHKMKPGGYAYIAPNSEWSIKNNSQKKAFFHWIRKKYQKIRGLEIPPSFVTNEQYITPIEMPNSEGKWSTTRFVEIDDLRYDCHVNIVNFKKGGSIPFAETHIMEHGIYVLQGRAKYRLNNDWIDIEAGDYMWLRAFCPQACIAKSEEDFRYLLYKDVNRHPKLEL